MKKLYFFITSLPFMAFLFLTLAFSMAIATFVESSYGTPAARSLIYNAFWFELLWGLFALNLVNNLFRYRLLNKQRFTMGLFHLAFIVMLIGAAVTRYFGYEGTMHIRENSGTDYLLSTADYFYAGFNGQEEAEAVQFSEFTPNQFSAKFDVNGRKVKVKSTGFIADAERKPIAAETGDPVIDFVFASPDQQGMQSFTFSEGDVLEYPGFTVGFETSGEMDVRFFMQGDSLFMVSKSPLEETTMSSGEAVRFFAGDTIPVKNMFLYNKDDFRFMVRGFYPRAVFTAAKSQAETHDDAVMIEISDGIRTQTVPVFGHSGILPDTVNVPLGNNTLKLAYGARKIPLSFQLYLKDFQLERYPGSNSPSSFASEVVLIDESEGIERDVRIFMNNTLMYKGYKFFQSSYDQDEKGTILSVNHDVWGTWISYISYIMLAVGFILSLVNKNSYFRVLIRRLQSSSAKAATIVILVAGFSFSANAQDDAGATIPKIDEKVVTEFSELWVQGIDGRIEPMSTLASEIVRKVSRKNSLYGRSPDEVVLSMMTYSDIWQSLPVIRVSEKELANELGTDGKYISVQQLFDAQGNYRIAEQVQAAYAKTPAFRNRLEKEYIHLDERVSICFMVFRGSVFHIYPREKKEDTWYAPGENASEYSGGDSIFIKNGFSLLLQSVDENNTAGALQVLGGIENFQQKFGSELLPSETKKEIEILYNKINPFERIFPYYLLFGFLLLFVLLVNIFRMKPLPKWLKYSFTGLIVILFLVHTVGLIARWYISG
ncbi:MAG: cytochrome c biogenesis protein ResB, partial [Tangfeifania sp.]